MNGLIEIRIAFFLLLFLSQTPYFTNTAVLDPALFLNPSPPLTSSSGDSEEIEPWSRNSRATKLQQVGGSTTKLKETTTVTSTTMEQEIMKNAETFWPKLHSIDYALKQVHIPITFTLSGNYGGYRASGVIDKSYASIGGPGLFSYGKSALAGSGYGNYGTSVRVYGGNDRPSWSGWGNGKWGHYGKG